MRRRFTGALAGALVAGSISLAAAPAQAQEICELGDQGYQPIVSMGPPIQIYVGNALELAVGVAGSSADYAACIARQQVNCIAGAGPSLPLVEVDTETLTVTIHNENLIGDARCLVGDPAH